MDTTTNIIAALSLLCQCQYRACCDEYEYQDGVIIAGRIVNEDLFSKFERISDHLISQLM